MVVRWPNLSGSLSSPSNPQVPKQQQDSPSRNHKKTTTSNSNGDGQPGLVPAHDHKDGSTSSSSGNDTNPNQGIIDDEGVVEEYGRTPPTTKSDTTLWERAGNLRQTLHNSFDFVGDACFSAAALTVVPCTHPLHATSDTTPSKPMKQYPNNNNSNDKPPSATAQADLALAKQQASAAATAKQSPTKKMPSSPLRRHRQHEEIEVLPNHKVQVRLPPTDHPAASAAVITPSAANNNTTDAASKKRRKAPVTTLEVKSNIAQELERSISELTMRSSYAHGSESLNKIPDNRRMAYYAVGKHHRQSRPGSGSGGNRRCYFTGKLILGGSPFYAGSVQNGLRTLVVFCLPSALGLPKQSDLKGQQTHSKTAAGLLALMTGSGTNNTAVPRDASSTASPNTHMSSYHHGGGHGPYGRDYSSRAPSAASLLEQQQRLNSRAMTNGSGGNNSGKRNYGGYPSSHSVASKSMSRLSSLDDLSLSIDGDLDPNWGLDKNFMLSVLPEASADLLQQMAKLYPDQFETLPIQVRDPLKWKLYVKFCFFSGLPIAEGEMHYKVRDDIAEQVYGEEIVLSHEVMEAVNGASAEILTLPNLKAFRYLRKHYAQQCSKLDDRVFRRNCWERVAPEV